MNYFWGKYDEYRQQLGEEGVENAAKSVRNDQRILDIETRKMEWRRVEGCVARVLVAATIWRRVWDEKQALWQHMCYLHLSNILAEMQRRREQVIRGSRSGEDTENELQTLECRQWITDKRLMVIGNTEHWKNRDLDEQGTMISRRRPWVGFRDEETGLLKDPG